MIRNYFKIAWRSIMRQKISTAINIIGLALGICACIVIYLITHHEFSYDRFHPDKERIYRITGEMQRLSGEKEFLNSVFSDIAGVEHDIPGFEAKAGIHHYYSKVNIPGNDGKEKKIDWNDNIIVTSPAYFDIFRYQWQAGNAASALNDPYKVVLTEKRAQQYFGNLKPNEVIGRTVVYNDSLQVTVSGVVSDWTGLTDFGFTDIISISSVASSFLRKEIPTADWTSLRPHSTLAFVKLNKGVSAEKVNSQLAAYGKAHVKESMYGKLMDLRLQPLTDIHFTSDYYRGDDGDGFRKAHLPTLYALMGIALFILLIAAINFINLSTAQSIQRAKEVGVRKVMGGSRRSLVLQFLTETFVLSLLAVLLSVFLVNPVLSLFRTFIPTEISFFPLHADTLLFLVSVTVVTTLLAGFYPAKILSSYLPVISLKGGSSQKTGGRPGFRKALIVFQFTVSLVFIIGTIIIGNQIRFMRDKDKGFKTDAIVTINSWTDKTDKLKLAADRIRHLTGVDDVILQATSPMGRAEMSSVFTYKGAQELSLEMAVKIGDQRFIPFYGMKIIAGRNMHASDSLTELIVNETCTRALGFKNPQEAIGERLHAGGKSFPIAGVVADFHLGSFRDAIKPMMIEFVPEWQRGLAVKLNTKGKHTGDIKAVILKMQTAWKEFFPEETFDYSFLNESISWLYEKDQQTAWLMNAAMFITIFISCMGIFGLAMFTARRRTKEIGIRKMLGASVLRIASMLSKDFIVLVLLAFAIASPLAWYFMNQWLREFAYRTQISWWVFALAGIAAIFIAVCTVSFQAIKAAVANPVKSLRTE